MAKQKRSKQLQELLVAEWLSGGFNQLAKELSTSPSDIEIMFNLNKHRDAKIAWRSAYIIDMIHDLDNDLLKKYIPIIISNLPSETNNSIKRHYARILTQHNLSDLADGNLIEACFEWLQKQDIPIAVKAHCMLILYNLCETYPELIHELIIVLENLLPYGSKGLVNRANKLLKKLYKSQ